MSNTTGPALQRRALHTGGVGHERPLYHGDIGQRWQGQDPRNRMTYTGPWSEGLKALPTESPKTISDHPKQHIPQQWENKRGAVFTPTELKAKRAANRGWVLNPRTGQREPVS